jgi:hypothetical protein
MRSSCASPEPRYAINTFFPKNMRKMFPHWERKRASLSADPRQAKSRRARPTHGVEEIFAASRHRLPDGKNEETLSMSNVRTSGALRRLWLWRGIRCGVALLTSIGLFGIHRPTALAISTARSAGASSQMTLAALSLSTPAPAQARPATSCGLTKWLTPESQTTTLGHMVSITEHWSCGPAAFLLVVFDFGDGNTTTYWCYFNCFSGSQIFTHTYAQRGTFVVYDGTYGEDSPSGTVVVR